MAAFDHYITFENGCKVLIKHEPASIPILRKFFKDFDPSLIVELGTSVGGLTMLMEESCNADIYTYDNKDSVYDHMKKFGYLDKFKRTTFVKQNVLRQPYFPLMELLKKDSRKILYCDNGNKAMEVNMYCRCLNLGDVVGVHDFGLPLICLEHMVCALAGFEELPINKEFEEAKCGSRFWMRKNWILGLKKVVYEK